MQKSHIQILLCTLLAVGLFVEIMTLVIHDHLQWSWEDMACYTLNALIDSHQKEYMTFCAGQQTANQL